MLVFWSGDSQMLTTVRLIGIFWLLSSLVVSARAADFCSSISGATIVANDGTYLGRISNQYDGDSVLNKYGRFGSEYSATSIWNKYGQYGGEYSSLSPFNKYTSTPPVIIINGQAVAHLSVANGSVNPFALLSCE